MSRLVSVPKFIPTLPDDVTHVYVAGALAHGKADAPRKALPEVPAFTPRRSRDYRKPWEVARAAPPTPPRSAASSAPWR